ncbi:hypothetical protein DV495_003989 [Geotrichum candidum]|nr:hypothetical protein DV452_003060 [Geotrichum candidum]KAF5124334.1 hypothetical protein DV495_003989 [Geotrichum candidum]KAF7498997.1 hypothetical protein DV113_002993 [Geotrichum candidum]KAI8135977.1 hypothetical protein DUD61_000400 [Geotrichum candidum]KAI9211344.1 hypothetical protein DS838_003763 [Geotrichum bryndzae]
MPLKALLKYLKGDDDKLMVQILARGLLGMFNAVALIYLKETISWTCTKVDKKSEAERYSSVTKWFWALQLVQFHIPFYISRTLPNFFAFPFTTLAIAYTLEANYNGAIGILAFTAIVFRSEIAVLLATLSFSLLIFRKVSLFDVIKSATIAGLIGTLLSLVVDSYFWQTPLMIPELKGFIFNVIEGKSADWGTEPLSAYFLIHLPKLLGTVARPSGYFILYGLVPFGFFKDPTGSKFNHLRILGLASLLFVAIYSLQPHKEWRFIVYVAPVFTLLAANGVVFISNQLAKAGDVLKISFQMAVITLIGVIAGLSVVKGLASSFNYPGGQALTQFHNHVPFDLKAEDPLVVHLDVPVCMTGANKFGQLFEIRSPNYPWVIYDKTEDVDELEEIMDSFDFLVSATAPADITQEYPLPEDYKWKLVDTVKSFNSINTKGLKNLIVAAKEDPQLFYNKAVVEGDNEFFINWGLQVLDLRNATYVYKRVEQVYPWKGIE